MKAQIPLLYGDRVEEADYRDALMTNMIAVERPIRGVNGYILTHPGLEEFGQSSGVDRGGVWNERFLEHYRVSGNDLLQISESGTTETLGTISGSGQVSLAQSFNTQAIVADGKYFLYDKTNGLRQITDENVGSPIDVTWIDGYYFFTDGENIYHTDIDDEESIDPLQFATAEFSPDETLGVAKTQDNQVVVFGRYSTEYFVNRATDNFAFQRISGQAVKSGIVGTHCKCELDGNFFILGGRKEESPSVHIIGPGRVDSIATREIEKIIATYAEDDLADVVIEPRTKDCYMFIIVHLPGETLLYNHTIAKSIGVSQAWTVLEDCCFNEWPAINGIFDPRISKWIYGDKSSSRLGQLNENISTQYGDSAQFIFYSPFISIDSASINELELDTIPGFTDDTATVSFSTTYNGMTYSKQWWNLYSEPNDYETRFIIRRIGYVREYIGFRFRTITEARMAYSNMEIDYG